MNPEKPPREESPDEELESFVGEAHRRVESPLEAPLTETERAAWVAAVKILENDLGSIDHGIIVDLFERMPDPLDPESFIPQISIKLHTTELHPVRGPRNNRREMNLASLKEHLEEIRRAVIERIRVLRDEKERGNF